jgi:hypothetical protein
LAKSDPVKLSKKRARRQGKSLVQWKQLDRENCFHRLEKEKKMCLRPETIDLVPEETTRIARAAYPKGNIYLQLRDTFGSIYQDEQFAELYPQRGQPAEAPWRLALVSVLQFREGLSDRFADV